MTERASAPVVATAAVVAGVTFAVAYDDGGYSLASRSTLGLLVWWTILVGLLLGVWRPVRSMRAAAVPGLLLAALAGWSVLSAAWSASAEDAVVEFDRTSLYLGIYVLVVFAARPGRLGAWIDGLALAIVATAGVALVSRLFPGSFPARGLPALLPSASTRLSFPVDYWNGLGILTGIAVPLLVHSALAGGRARRMLSIGVVPALGAVLYLTSSRGALAATALGTLVLVVAYPRRFAALGTAAAGVVGAAVAVAAVASRHAVVDGPLGSATARSEGREAAAAVVVICVLTAAGFEWLRRAAPRLPAPSRGVRRLAVAVVVVLAVAGAAYEARSFGSFTRLPPTTGSPGTVGEHLLNGSGSGRWQFWTAALDEFRSSPLHGGGPGSFEAWWAQHGSFRYFVKDAHSIFAQTLAELGIVGFLLLVAFLGLALTIGMRRLLPAEAPQRAALAALLGAFTVYLLGAAVDWMWELTVVTAVGLVLLALLAGPSGAPAEDDGCSRRPRCPCGPRPRGSVVRRRRARRPPRRRRGRPEPDRRGRRPLRRRPRGRPRRDEARAVGRLALPPARPRRGEPGRVRRGEPGDRPGRVARRPRLAALAREGADRRRSRSVRERSRQPRAGEAAQPALAHRGVAVP